ncbi:MAG: hypothetical protein ACMX3H_09855 [Sodalis sp. (in: enterobacteria)]
MSPEQMIGYVGICNGYGWAGVVAFITVLLLVGLYVAQRLRRLPALRAV